MEEGEISLSQVEIILNKLIRDIERVERLGDLVDYYSTQTDKTIGYHYTSVNALISIHESNTLWATNASFLNDSSEYLHGLQFQKTIAEFFMTQIREDGQDLMYDDHIHEMLDALLAHISIRTISDTYTFSLSRNGDLLSQWRSYADDGHGFAIGFDLVELAAQMSGFPQISRVLYEEKEKTKISLDRISSFCIRFGMKIYEHTKSASSSKDTIVLAGKKLIEYADRWACQMKHSGFSEEAELRALISPRIPGELKDVKIRVLNGQMAPYIVIRMKDEKPLAIREIITGPKVDVSMARKALETLLPQTGHVLSDVDIRPSVVPMR